MYNMEVCFNSKHLVPTPYMRSLFEVVLAKTKQGFE